MSNEERAAEGPSIDMEQESGADEQIEESEMGHWRVAKNSRFVELPREQESNDEFTFTLPRDIFESLYPYQRTGVAWMARLWQDKLGGILADEMGLGKTVQVCALLNGARRTGATHALLLLPVTLLDQWAKEARHWCPGWPVYIYYGSGAKRIRALRRISRPKGGLLLTSYALLSNSESDLFNVTVQDEPSPIRKRKGKPTKRRRMDYDDMDEADESESEDNIEAELPPGELPKEGSTRPWDIVICDEAHRMKNISTLLGKSLRRVRSNCRLLLTGTPVQNALQDLWALTDFAQPGMLGNHATFVKHFSDPIDRGSVRGATPFQVELKKHLSEQLRSLMAPHLLRRTKANAGLLDEGDEAGDEAGEDGAMEDAMLEEGEGSEAQAKKLPPKFETIIWLAPSAVQADAYEKVLAKSEVIREACAKQKLGFEVFRAIGLLKRLCNHPTLLIPCPRPGNWAELIAEATSAHEVSQGVDAVEADTDGAVVLSDAANESLALVAGATGGAATEADDARANRSIEMALKRLPRNLGALVEQSAKLKCLASLLPALAMRGHRTLVFSQSVKMLDLVQLCCLKPNGLRCLRIDGSTDALLRAAKVSKFQGERERFQFMLLTTTVGGVGLNLTSADRVILVDPAWNPASDAQAVDRAFRIGQEREVRVYRLIMSGLIEDKMFRLQVFKMGLTRTALEVDQQHRYFTSREIRALFDWTDPAVGETRRMLAEKHGEEVDTVLKDHAKEDGADDGWMVAGLTVGISDFSMLYGGLGVEEEPDAECSVQVEEAKQKLGAADEKLQRRLDARKAAHEHLEALAKELEDAGRAAELVKEKRTIAEELLKEKRSEHTHARRAESLAQQRLEKAIRSRASAQDQQVRTSQAAQQLEESAQIASRTVQETCSTARSAEEAFSKALVDSEGQLAIVDDRGSAVGNGVVDAAADAVKKANKALEKVRNALDALGTRQAELDIAEEELVRADAGHATAGRERIRLGDGDGIEETDMEAAIARKAAVLNQKKCEKDKQKCEQALARVQQKVETSRDTMAQSIQHAVEACGAFADSFQKIPSRPGSLVSARTAAKAVFKCLPSTWQSARKAREGCTKAYTLCRKATQRAADAIAASVEAEGLLAGTEREYAQVAAKEESSRTEVCNKDRDLSDAEAAWSAVEAEEGNLKRRRDELRAALPLAKEAMQAAKRSEKEALGERQALHAAASKAEKAQLQMEEAKQSATQILHAEAYDVNQVERAFEHAKKASEEG